MVFLFVSVVPLRHTTWSRVLSSNSRTQRNLREFEHLFSCSHDCVLTQLVVPLKITAITFWYIFKSRT